LQIVRCVEHTQIAHMLSPTSRAELERIFAAAELEDVGDAVAGVSRLAARLAAKQCCLAFFPQEARAGAIGLKDFVITRDGYGAPSLVVDAKLRALLDRYRIESIALSLSHDRSRASAVAVAQCIETRVPVFGKFMYYLLPFRRRVLLDNLRRAFSNRVPEREIVRIAQAHYAHYLRLIVEFFRYPWLPASRRVGVVRVENQDALMRAVLLGKGVLIVTAHLGNWEVATAGAMENFPQLRNRIHMLRRKLWPQLLYDVMANRLRQAGIGVLFKRGTLDTLLERLAAAEVVVFVLDQHAGGRDGVEVEFFGHPAWVFRSPAVIARATGAAVVPANSWRAPDGRHVVRFEDAVPFIDCDDPDECIRRNTRAYVAAVERFILRHPEQWGMWMHRMWKGPPSEVAARLPRRIAQRVLKALKVEL
jgi:lauroyl/myristoyl acyltransferase/phosphopantetheinyl transferase (holo-ACP synthase)